MSDILTREQRSERMSRVKGKDSKPELHVRSLIHNMGFRFRLHVAYLPGKPDILLPRHPKIILMHGCYWHRPTLPRRPHANARKLGQRVPR